MVIDH